MLAVGVCACTFSATLNEMLYINLLTLFFKLNSLKTFCILIHLMLEDKMLGKKILNTTSVL